MNKLIMICLVFFINVHIFQASSIKSSNSQELEQENKSFKDKELKPLTPFQTKILLELKKIEEFRNFPPGLSELIVSYKPTEYEATTRLLNIVRDGRLNSEEEIEMIKELVYDGANVNHENYGEYANSPLDDVLLSFWLYPTTNNKKLNILRLELIKFLVEKGVNVNASSVHYNWNNTLLTNIIVLKRLSAARFDNDQTLEIVKFLLDNKANPNIWNRRFNFYNTVKNDSLLISSLDGPTEIFKLLLEYGANPDEGMDVFGRQFDEIIKDSKYNEHRKIYNKWQKEKSKNKETTSSNSKCVIF